MLALSFNCFFYSGSPPAMGSSGMMILVVLVLAFMLVLLLLALFIANFQKKHKAIPIYVDENGRENIMPYNDEGLFLFCSTTREDTFPAGKLF